VLDEQTTVVLSDLGFVPVLVVSEEHRVADLARAVPAGVDPVRHDRNRSAHHGLEEPVAPGRAGGTQRELAAPQDLEVMGLKNTRSGHGTSLHPHLRFARVVEQPKVVMVRRRLAEL
jgi:hypothetical protein